MRFDDALNARLEALAGAAGMTVSEFIRWAVTEVAERETRLSSHRAAAALFASLPQVAEPDREREEMWGTADRVPR